MQKKHSDLSALPAAIFTVQYTNPSSVPGGFQSITLEMSAGPDSTSTPWETRRFGIEMCRRGDTAMV